MWLVVCWNVHRKMKENKNMVDGSWPVMIDTVWYRNRSNIDNLKKLPYTQGQS